MAGPLTWKNVDAPSLAGTGDLLAGAQSSFANAMATLQAGAEAAAAQRRQRYSAKALQGLAGVQDPNAVAGYLSSLNAEDLTPEVMAIAMKQPDVLLERQKFGLGLEEAKGDLQFKVNSREGALAAMDNLMAMRNASMRGDTEGALQQQEGITNPFELQAIMGANEDIYQNATDFRTTRDANKTYADNLEAEQRTDRLRTNFYENLLPNANSKDEAIRTFMDSDASPEDKQAFEAMMADRTDEEFQRIDPTTTTIFEQSPVLNEAAVQNESTQNWLNTVITDKVEANPITRFETFSRKLSEATNDDGSQKTAVDKLQEVFGIEAPGLIGWDGMNQQIEDIKDRAQAAGLSVDENDVIAAIRENQTTSGIAFVDTQVFNTDGVFETLKSVKDPTLSRASLAELDNFDRFNERLTTIGTKLESLSAQERVERGKGQTTRAAETAKAIAELLDQQTTLMETFMENNGLSDTVNSDEAPVPAGSASAATTGNGQLAEPAVDPAQAAILKQMADAIRMDVVTPAERDYPFSPNFFDQSAMRTLPQPRSRGAIEEILSRFAR